MKKNLIIGVLLVLAFAIGWLLNGQFQKSNFENKYSMTQKGQRFPASGEIFRSYFAWVPAEDAQDSSNQGRAIGKKIKNLCGETENIFSVDFIRFTEANVMEFLVLCKINNTSF